MGEGGGEEGGNVVEEEGGDLFGEGVRDGRRDGVDYLGLGTRFGGRGEGGREGRLEENESRR